MPFGHMVGDGRVLTVRAVQATMGGDLHAVVVCGDLGGGQLHVEDPPGQTVGHGVVHVLDADVVYLFNGLCAGLSRVCWPCYR